MKNNISTKLFLIPSVSALIISSCTANTLPKIKNPEYRIVNAAGERGYDVSFDVNGTAKPTAVVINKIQQEITDNNKEGQKYKVHIITQSKRIFGFKPNIVEKENGIYFKTDSSEVFKPVKFVLKDK